MAHGQVMQLRIARSAAAARTNACGLGKRSMTHLGAMGRS